MGKIYHNTHITGKTMQKLTDITMHKKFKFKFKSEIKFLGQEKFQSKVKNCNYFYLPI